MGRGNRRQGSTSTAASGLVERAQAALAAATGDGDDIPTITSARQLQSLWAGYGSVWEASTEEEKQGQQLIIKEIGGWGEAAGSAGRPGGSRSQQLKPWSQRLVATLPAAPPPGSGVSHLRKLRSYRVEAAFYERVVPRLPPGTACNVPRCLGVHSTLGTDDGSCGGGMQLVLSDLRPEFPRR